MVKFSFIFVVIFSTSLFANTSYALKSLDRVMSSLDHVSSVEARVSADYLSSDEHITANGTLVSYLDTHAVYEDDREDKVFVKNKRGIFHVQKGDASEMDAFPIPLPTDFLDAFDSETLTQNYVFSVLKNTNEYLVLSVVPVFSVQLIPGEAVTTMLKLTIDKPDYLLTKVEIFSNYQLKPNETLEFSYVVHDYVPYGSRSKVTRRGHFIAAFDSFFEELEEDSYGLRYFSKTRYEFEYNRINDDIDMDVFDEDEY